MLGFTPLVNFESMTTKSKTGTGSMESWEEHVLLFYIRISSSRTLLWTANKARTMLFYLKRSFAALSPSIFPPVQNLYPAISWICHSSSQYHPIPQRRDTGSVWSSWKSFDMFRLKQPSSSVIYSPSHTWRPNSHVQVYPLSPGIPHDFHLRPSNPQRATRPRLQVPPIEMLYGLFVPKHNLGG